MRFPLCFLLLSLIVVKVHSNKETKSEYDSKINQAVNVAINNFDDAQKKKMQQGFTSNAKRSYKKTKQ